MWPASSTAWTVPGPRRTGSRRSSGTDLGDLTGRDVLHLQCHLGTETAAFADRGAAHTVGLDFSAAAVTEARTARPDGRTGHGVRPGGCAWRRRGAGGRQFDVIYTGKGALCYLPDLTAWAGIVSALLRPGGTLYLVEFHPLLDALGPTPSPDRQQLTLHHDYLAGPRPAPERYDQHLHRRPARARARRSATSGGTASARWSRPSSAPGWPSNCCARPSCCPGSGSTRWCRPTTAGGGCRRRSRSFRCCTRCGR